MKEIKIYGPQTMCGEYEGMEEYANPKEVIKACPDDCWIKYSDHIAQVDNLFRFVKCEDELTEDNDSHFLVIRKNNGVVIRGTGVYYTDLKRWDVIGEGQDVDVLQWLKGGVICL